jgi:alpha-N-arabinofuranosidase
MLLIAIFSGQIWAGLVAEAREIVVGKNGSDTGTGDAAHPFLTIQRAADLAIPGDTITVGAGVYRERVDPPRGGTSVNARIVYRAAPGEDVRITGSEHVLARWSRHGSIWKVVLLKSFFGVFNPFATLVRNPHLSEATITTAGVGYATDVGPTWATSMSMERA